MTLEPSNEPPLRRPSPATPAVPATMRAACLQRYGRPEEVLAVADVPVPAPGPTQVLLRVRAASVNALDWHFTTGLPMFARISLGLRRPRRTVLGADVAGTVVAVGVAVTAWQVGDEVFGEVAGGAFAEYALADQSWLVARPDGLGAETAATLGVAAETALQALRDWGRLVGGERVLVNGASGGVGTFAVQLAQALGAGHVTAVCSTDNVEQAEALGADEVVDYRTEPYAAVGDGFDLYLDNAGTQPLRDCRDRLARGGRYVMVTAPKSTWLHPLPRMLAGPVPFLGSGRQAVVGKVAERSQADLELLGDLVLRGAVRPVIERRWTLAEVPEAIRVQGEFHGRGKALVIP